MKALSIRQPWAWLIVNGFKDIENRNWYTLFRGKFLVHASKTLNRRDYEDECQIAMIFAHRQWKKGGKIIEPFPKFDEVQRGGIVGQSELVDCVKESNSEWFVGDYGFVLKNAKPIPFIPIKGSLGFFNVNYEGIQ